ncbi:MAG: DUF2179 domain-containing protein [Bacteroidales bacterium]|jgi:uncharacterized protein YebE (UPF0316 family)
MVAPEWISTDIFNWVVLPLLIAIARILDVSVGTVRLIFVSRGYKYLAPLLGFVEVIIWLLAIGQIMQQLDNFMSYIGYGAGFAMGNYIGIILVEKMSIGTVIIRIIPKFDTVNLVKHLREANYGVTSVDAEGKNGPINMLFSIVKKKDLNGVLQIINKHNPNAFYSIEEVQKVNEGHFVTHHKRGFLSGGIFGNSLVRK